MKIAGFYSATLKNSIDMAKTLQHYAKWVVNIILGLGCWLIVNESDTFVPNFIGLACAALLIVINRDKK